MTIKFVFLFSRQGKLRLAKWFNSYPEKVPKNPGTSKLNQFNLVFLPPVKSFSLQDKKKLTRDVISLVLARGPKMCSFIEYKDDLKIVYKRYARCFLKMDKIKLSLVLVFSSVLPIASGPV